MRYWITVLYITSIILITKRILISRKFVSEHNGLLLDYPDSINLRGFYPARSIIFCCNTHCGGKHRLIKYKQPNNGGAAAIVPSTPGSDRPTSSSQQIKTFRCATHLLWQVKYSFYGGFLSFWSGPMPKRASGRTFSCEQWPERLHQEMNFGCCVFNLARSNID